MILRSTTLLQIKNFALDTIKRAKEQRGINQHFVAGGIAALNEMVGWLDKEIKK